MPIYTKQGDRGWSMLASGAPIRKSSPQIAAYGALDVVSAQLARAAALAGQDTIHAPLAELLDNILHHLATAAAVAAGYSDDRCQITADDCRFLEETIDSYTTLSPLPKYLIIPGGTPLALELNLARTQVRQAELFLWQAIDGGTELPDELPVYLNRLSDLLYVLANYVNSQAGFCPGRWQP